MMGVLLNAMTDFYELGGVAAISSPDNDQDICLFAEGCRFGLANSGGKFLLYTLGMDRLSLLLPKVLKRRGLHQLAEASFVVLRAQEWIKAHMGMQAPSITARKFADSSVLIEAGNPIALSEVSRRGEELRVFLKEALPEVTITAVRCVRGNGISRLHR